MPDPRLYEFIFRNRAALLKQEAAAATRLTSAYLKIYGGLKENIRALEADIKDLGPDATQGQVERLARYRSLLTQTQEQMDKYAVVVDHEVGALRTQAIESALKESKSLVQLALPALPSGVKQGILANFNVLNSAAVENISGALQKGSPLADLLDTFGADNAMKVGDAITQGVGLGYNPTRVADQIVTALGNNLTRALTISRTEVLRAFRTATLSNYAANSDVVKGWRWSATRDGVCCLACLALDGQEFGLDQVYMEAHPNCRCAPVPVTVSYRDLGIDAPEIPDRQPASEWFQSLPESEQQGFFTAAAWQAYQAGDVTLNDFIGKQESKDWGNAFVERSLKDILGERANQYYN